MSLSKRLAGKLDWNTSALSPWALFPACFVLVIITLFFVSQDGAFLELYPEVQKPVFYAINKFFSAVPLFEENITQLGDALVSMSLLSIFLVLAPRFWAWLLNASLMSLAVAPLLKHFFSMPRPAAVYLGESFTIVGKRLLALSLPSGHSMTIFIAITLIIIAFYPKGTWLKGFVWLSSWITLGLFIALSRVAVGAHYPLDVLIGASLASILSIFAVYLNCLCPLWHKIPPRFYQLLMSLVFILASGWLAYRYFILGSELIIYLLAGLMNLLTSFLLIKNYVQK